MKSFNKTPQSERLHIGIFGRRNAGKSSLLNAITGQNMAVVSPVKGTTTDPVSKAMEIPPIGPVLITDTAGLDDYGELGKLRTDKTRNVLRKTDVALLVVDAKEGLADEDKVLIKTLDEMGVKYLTVYNKVDLVDTAPHDGFPVSAKNGTNIHELKEKITDICHTQENNRRLVADIITKGDIVVLVTPIDKAAPKGRLILPQQQAIRDIIDTGAISIVVRDSEFRAALEKLKELPQLVITDSQVFDKISKETPGDVKLTSFSILMARYKGVLDYAVQGAKTLDKIAENDKILISEGCTHHRQCDDIGTVKLPRWIEKHTGVKPRYEFTSGGDFPQDLCEYKLIIHCGGCMLNNREMLYRQHIAQTANVPMTNYGIAISYMQGILERCISPFKKE
ncbi:MAG: [FeFe] hydrogenase H-cluster maturation GTPase HydF [Defluviitaleaceae bacterium]|nr:[FeFe] hydrogenase H-cluster maturation GTPase HydF [Defluviitaleaceae bacterium]